ncbi:MAG: tetratricopeptide repeat protein [Elusimicrobiaceae bacterium]|nr:tetratricopeptide repeat protein [Elusimicrobiaceae bacterium]
MRKTLNLLVAAWLFAGLANAAAGVSDLAGEATRLSNEGKQEEAIAKFNEAIRLAPENASLYLNLGLVYQGMGRYADAVSSIEKAISLGERGVRTYATLAFGYEALAVSTQPPLSPRPYWDKARDAWTKVLSLETDPGKQHMARKHIDRIEDITK